MAKCTKCNGEFKPTIHNIWHCKKCIAKGLKKWLKMPVDECIQLQAKKLLES